MLDWMTISYANWQPKAGALGEAVFGHLDVEQSVEAIILTEKSTVPLEPEKCVRLMPWVDAPERVAIPNFAREIWDGVSTYEPRVVLTSISVAWVSYCHWLFRVSLHLAGDVEKRIRTVEVPYGPT